MTFAHLCDSVPVVDNRLSMGADVYVRAARARALKAEELDFEGRFPTGVGLATTIKCRSIVI